MKPPSYAPVYALMYPVLAEIAQSKGYGLSLHGSITRDLDVIAIPWTEEATTTEELVAAFFEYAEAWIGFKFAPEHPNRIPEAKPHGRLAWNIPIGKGAVIDLSVLPRHAINKGPHVPIGLIPSSEKPTVKKQAYKQLSTRDLSILKMLLEDCSYKECAARFSLNISTIPTAAHRALRLLGRHISERVYGKLPIYAKDSTDWFANYDIKVAKKNRVDWEMAIKQWLENNTNN